MGLSGTPWKLWLSMADEGPDVPGQKMGRRCFYPLCDPGLCGAGDVLDSSVYPDQSAQNTRGYDHRRSGGTEYVWNGFALWK
mgnify:CR=1 FL=1